MQPAEQSRPSSGQAVPRQEREPAYRKPEKSSEQKEDGIDYHSPDYIGYRYNDYEGYVHPSKYHDHHVPAHHYDLDESYDHRAYIDSHNVDICCDVLPLT